MNEWFFDLPITPTVTESIQTKQDKSSFIPCKHDNKCYYSDKEKLFNYNNEDIGMSFINVYLDMSCLDGCPDEY
jgi:5-deoxy-D-glucuronate isomerase